MKNFSKKSFYKFILLFLLMLSIVACRKKEYTLDGKYRYQLERDIFIKEEVSEEEIEKVRNLKDVGADFAYYRQLGDIRGYTADGTGMLYLVNIIIAYNFRDKKISLEIANKHMYILDGLRNRLSRLSGEDFTNYKEAELREILLNEVNRHLTSGKALDIIILRSELYDTISAN